MIRLPALLLLLPLVQDEPVELKWAAEPEDKFDLKWTYDDANTRVSGRGDRSEISDKRTVEAEMLPTEQAGKFAVTLKKVTWSYSNAEFDISLAWAAGPKPPAATFKLKVDPKASNAAVAKSLGEQRLETMKTIVSEGAYALTFDANRGETAITRNGSAGRMQSVFDVLFLHSPLPKGTVTHGQTWKESVEQLTFPQLVEVKTMGCKVTYAANAVGVKGGFTQPINRTGNAKGESITGSFTFNREFSFAKEGCLLNSKEERLFSKKVDAKGEDADFYRENSTHNIKQSVTFKRKGPPKPPPEPKK